MYQIASEQKPITARLDLRYWGWFPRFEGWQLSNLVATQRYDIVFSQAIWCFLQIGPEGLMYFLGFASIDLSYANMPTSNFRSQKDYNRRSCHLYTEVSGTWIVSIDRNKRTDITGLETKHDFQALMTHRASFYFHSCFMSQWTAINTSANSMLKKTDVKNH